MSTHHSTTFCITLLLRTHNGLVEVWKEFDDKFSGLKRMETFSTRWPCVTACVQSILNHSPVKKLGVRDISHHGAHRAPIECFTGTNPTIPLFQTFPMKSNSENYSEEAKVRQPMNTQGTQKALQEIHKSIEKLSSRNLRRQIQKQVRTSDKEILQWSKKLFYLWLWSRIIALAKYQLAFEVDNLIDKE